MVKKYIFAALLSVFFVALSASSAFAEAFSFPGAAVTEGENNTYTVEVTDDAFFSEKLTFPANSTIIVNGNDHKITRATGFTDSFLSIPSTTKLTINNLVVDGNAPDWNADLVNTTTYNENNRTYGQYSTSRTANDIVATAAVIANAGQLTLNSFTLQNTLSNPSGGINSTGSLTIDSSTFTHNLTYQGHGGAIRSANGELTIANSSFSGNGAGDRNNHYKDGGAIHIVSGHATIDNVTFANNFTLRSGGAILIENANADISNSTFRGNIAGNDGSAILMWGSYARSGVVNYKNNKFIENKCITYNVVNGNGEGTVATYGRGFGTITFDGDEFTDNMASWGPIMSIYDEYSPKTLKNLVIKNVKTSGNKTSNGSSMSIEIEYIANVTIENYSSENDLGYVFIYSGENANYSNIKTTGSWYTYGVQSVIADGVEVNGKENDNPYFLVSYSTNVTTKDFSAKTHGSNSLPGIRNADTVELENIDTEGQIDIRDVEHVVADTLSSSNDTYDGISFARIGNLTAKNITLKDYETEGSALYLYSVTKGDLENVEISGVNGTGYSLLEFSTVGEITVKNLVVDGNTNTNTDGNSIIDIYDSSSNPAPENRSITFENTQITNNHSAGLGGGLTIMTRSIPVTFDENSMIINNESGMGGDDVYIVETDTEPQLITLPNVIWEDKQEEEAIILGSIVIDDMGAHYLKVTVLADNPATGDDIHYEFIVIGCVLLVAGTYLVRARRNYRR